MKNEETAFLQIASPIGPLLLEANEKALCAIHFNHPEHKKLEFSSSHPILAEAEKQLTAYFTGNRRVFGVPLATSGTVFEEEVWEQLKGIPYGTTISYSTLAKQLGDIKKVRAVGRANGQNPLPIIVPCHRVIGADGSLTGYAGGIERKRWLLQHEGALLL